MKKRNLVLQAAVAGALVTMFGAQAGTLTGTASYAVENWGPTATAALGITPPAIVYTFNTPGGIVVNPTGVIYAYLRVANGIFSTAPLAAQLALGGGISGLTATVGALSTDSTTVRVALTNGTTNNVTIGVGGTLTYTGIANAFTNVNTVLGTAGGAVSAQASISTTTSTPNTGTALPADLDNGVSNTLNFATSAVGVTGAVAASSTFAVTETQKIDLTATAPGSRFTAPGATLSNANSTTVVNLGSLKFTDGTANQVNGTTAYTLVGRSTAGTLGGTVTGAFKTGATAQLTTDLACTIAVGGGTAALNAGLTTFTFATYAVPATTVPYYVCLTTPATTATIPVTTPTASFTTTKATGTDAANTAAGTLYALGNNGATVDVRSYIPAVTVGYTSFVRVINTGSVTATVSGQWLYEDGTSSVAAPLITSHPAGGSKTLTSTQIEAALGAPTATIGNNRPRLRLTAPTNALSAQSFFLNPGNGFATMHGAD